MIFYVRPDKQTELAIVNLPFREGEYGLNHIIGREGLKRY
jgi:hypothetical protein